MVNYDRVYTFGHEYRTLTYVTDVVTVLAAQARAATSQPADLGQ